MSTSPEHKGDLRTPTGAGRVLADRYRLDREVGRGGMGVVWLARDEVLGRDVAVKRVGMLPGADAPDVARAEREARLAAGLNHPNVVAVFDLVVDRDEQWLVMEYVPGRTLTQLVAVEGPLSPDRAADLVGQAADALAAAHAAGIVHRDVKPSNILVTDDGLVKITDFGIAKSDSDATLTKTGLMSGSPAYLPPEVASGESAGPHSDVWSLGATLYHALVGRPPYEVNGNVIAVLYQIVHEEPPRPAEAGWLAPLLESTMDRDLATRWSMARVREFLRDRGHVAAPGPDDEATRTMPIAPAAAPAAATAVEAPVEPPAAAARREPRRDSRLPLAVGALLVALALVGLLWSALGDEDEPTRAGGGGDRASATPSEEAPAEEEPAEEEPEPEQKEPEAAEMESFVNDYLATVTEDSRSSWQRLTPEFQNASGGYGSYRGFWATIDSAEVREISASPEDMTVSYLVHYVKKNGDEEDDRVTLQLVEQGGGLLIAGES